MKASRIQPGYYNGRGDKRKTKKTNKNYLKVLGWQSSFCLEAKWFPRKNICSMSKTLT